MALMFQRLARNFIKNGYFPTNAETTRRVLSALQPGDTGEFRILDPCCGEGVALAECKHHLGADRTEAFGVEYDEERAWHAKGICTLPRGIRQSQHDERRLAARRASAGLAVVNSSERNTADSRLSSCPAGAQHTLHCGVAALAKGLPLPASRALH